MEKECNCIFYHPQTQVEVDQLIERLAYHTRIKDGLGVNMIKMQLSGVRQCPANQGKGLEVGV